MVNPSAEKRQCIFPLYTKHQWIQMKRCSTQKYNVDALNSCWGQQNVLNTNDNPKMEVNWKKYGRPSFLRAVPLHKHADPRSMNPPSASGFIAYWLDNADHDVTFFFSSCTNVLNSIDIYFGNDRNTLLSKNVPVVVDELQELVKVILVTYINSLSIYCHSATRWVSLFDYNFDFWVMTSSSQFADATFCIGLCQMMVVLCLIMITNTSCFVFFLSWFLDRNSIWASLSNTQQ